MDGELVPLSADEQAEHDALVAEMSDTKGARTAGDWRQGYWNNPAKQQRFGELAQRAEIGKPAGADGMGHARVNSHVNYAQPSANDDARLKALMQHPDYWHKTKGPALQEQARALINGEGPRSIGTDAARHAAAKVERADQANRTVAEIAEHYGVTRDDVIRGNNVMQELAVAAGDEHADWYAAFDALGDEAARAVRFALLQPSKWREHVGNVGDTAYAEIANILDAIEAQSPEMHRILCRHLGVKEKL